MKNIYLIGFMGCGKSTVAACFSKLYHARVLEMDEMIVNREKRSISDIFAAEGEEYFRQVETGLLAELAKEPDCIVSCGGGVALRSQNVELMKESGSIVFLTATPETILERVKDDDARPLLQGNKNVSFIREMLEKRYPHYEKAADVVVATDGKDAETICREIYATVSHAVST